MKYFAIVTLMVSLFTVSATQAEVKPENTVLSTYCGENEALAGERNRIITQVCLSVVQGKPGVSLVTVHSKNADDTELAVQTLPVVARGTDPLAKTKPGTKLEVLTLGTNQTTKSGHYTMYVSRSARLTSRTSLTSTPAAYMPTSISGQDLSGVAFNVSKLEGVVHTESVEK